MPWAPGVAPFHDPANRPMPPSCRTTPLEQIRRAYRNLVTREHPDKGGDAEKFRLIQQAYEVLSDSSKVGGAAGAASQGREGTAGWQHQR